MGLDCCAKCGAKFVVLSSATIYLLLGVLTSVGFGYGITSYVRVLLPWYVLGLGLTAGILVTLISVTGFCAACSCKGRPFWWLISFIFFTLLTFVGTGAVTASLVHSSTLVDTADDVGVGKDGAAVATRDAREAMRAVSVTLGTVLTEGFQACDANMTTLDAHFDPLIMTTANVTVKMACRDPSLEPMAKFFNSECLCSEHPIDTRPNSTYMTCYTDTNMDWPNTTSPTSGTTSAGDMARGVFCQCQAEGFGQGYLRSAVAVCIVLDIFFGLVLCACLYLLCCAEYRGDDLETDLLSNRVPDRAARPRSALVERMRAKYATGVNDASGQPSGRADRAASLISRP